MKKNRSEIRTMTAQELGKTKTKIVRSKKKKKKKSNLYF